MTEPLAPNHVPTVLLYYVPQTFPCGQNSTCCGPIGQSDDELREYQSAIERNLPDVRVERVNVSKEAGGKLKMGRDMAVIKLLNSFGYQACPIFALDGEVVSMGPPAMDELVALLREKLSAKTRAGPISTT